MSVHLYDIHDSKIDVYTSAESIQKATVYQAWSSYKKNLFWAISSHGKTIVLLDESHFLYYRLHVHIQAKKPYSRSEYKHLINEKIEQVQRLYWVQRHLVRYVTKNIYLDGKKTEYFVWETGELHVDICFFVLDEQRSDLAWYPDVGIYPRWFFLLQQPLFGDTGDLALLHILPHSSSLVQIQDGWYDVIHSLNGGDDLLWQAYEQAGIDPYSIDQIDIGSHTLWGKLLQEAHSDFAQLVIRRLHSHIDTGKTLYLTSRLVDQPFFVQQFGDVYTRLIQGMLVPYRGGELTQIGNRSWSSEELPALLAFRSVYQP